MRDLRIPALAAAGAAIIASAPGGAVVPCAVGRLMDGVLVAG